jgi:hypothetical protein
MITFISCEKDEVKVAKLNVTVKNAAGTAQSNASVELFDQLTLDTESEKSTDSNGKATFSLKGDKLYSVYAEKGNLAGGFKITNILFSGEEYEISVTIN